MTYTTIQGDMWDAIAHKAMGSTSYTDRLINANPKHHNVFVFPAGVVLNLPDAAADMDTAPMPPWKQVNG